MINFQCILICLLLCCEVVYVELLEWILFLFLSDIVLFVIGEGIIF